MKLYQQPILQLAASSVLFGLGAVFVVFIELNATVIAFYRLLIAAILFGLYLVIKRDSFRINFPALLLAALSGIFLGVDLAMWNTSILMIGPGIATILNSLQVFFMAFFAILFYRDMPSMTLWGSLLITFLGVVLLCSNEIQQSVNGLAGVIIGIVSGIAFALSMLCLRVAAIYQTNSLINTIFYSSLAGAIATGCYAAVEGSRFAIPDTQSLIMILIYGGIVHVVAWFLMAYSIAYVAVAVVGLIMCLEPVMVFIIDLGFLGKSVTTWQYIGAILTITAIYLGTLAAKKKNRKKGKKT